MVTVTATQSGAGIYSAASPISQNVVVAPAVLTIVGNNLTRVNNVPNPPFTYTVTGFVNGDTTSRALHSAPSLQRSVVAEYPFPGRKFLPELSPGSKIRYLTPGSSFGEAQA